MPELPLHAARVPCRSTSKALTNKGAGAESSLINKLVTAMGLPCLGNGNQKGSEPLLKILGGKSAKGIASPQQAQLGDIPSSAASDSGISIFGGAPGQLALPPIPEVARLPLPFVSTPCSDCPPAQPRINY